MVTEPSNQAARDWVLDCGARYWPTGRASVEALPIPLVESRPETTSEFLRVRLPPWAEDIGVDGTLLAYPAMIESDDGRPQWQRCDWLSNAFHMLNGTVERQLEADNGPVLSYAARLPGTLAPLFDHAWVNRIFLFLRRWAAHAGNTPEDALFGPMPPAEIRLTHDVDAIRLTPEIRAKQIAFQMLNAGRAAASARWSTVGHRLADAARYGFASGDFRTFARVRAMERAAGLTSILHFYAGPAGWRRASPHLILLDPAYDICSDGMRAELRAFAEGGWTVGLHQSFDAWRDGAAMVTQKHRLETALGHPVSFCRQHWLHFSWAQTWAAQVEAGLEHDSTLGFNDRPGFRGGHALAIAPRDPRSGTALMLEATPMVLMDSHFYDYAGGDAPPPDQAMKPWIDEIRAVGGVATVNWHTHTITDIYGWQRGYEALLKQLA